MNIIPKPAFQKAQDGYLAIRGLPGITVDPAFSDDFSRETNAFRNDLESDFKTKKEASLARIICQKQIGHEDEGYGLRITKDGIELAASAAAGLWHGLQTVRQMLLSGETAPGSGEFSVPLGEIKDHPRFPWRGLMLDCSRHFYTTAFIKKILRSISLHHINIFHWHLTDDQGWRFPVQAYPLLTEIGSRRQDHRRHDKYIGGFYTDEEIKEIVAFAADRHIEAVPEVDIPGHASSILAAYPGMGCTGGPYRVEDRYGIFEDVLCAGNDQIFDLVAAVFDSLAKLFPSKYIHIGGDEVRFNRWESCPKCRKRLSDMKLKNPRELQSWITARLAGMLAERGKTGIGWDEILEDTEEFRLPKDMIVMSWRGVKGGHEAVRQGRRVIMTPNTCGCYLDYRHSDDPEEPGQISVSRVSQIYNMESVSPGMSGEEAKLVLGGQGNLWSEIIYSGKIAEYMIFPRICALAENLWSPDELQNLDDFARRLTVHRERLDRLDLLHYRGDF